MQDEDLFMAGAGLVPARKFPDMAIGPNRSPGPTQGRPLPYEDLVSLWTVCFPQARQNFLTSTLYSFRLPREKW